MDEISQSLAAAVAHHQAGRLPEAEATYRRILEIAPDNAHAWHLLGVVESQHGNQQLAIEHIRRAIELDGREAAFHGNLGTVFRALGQGVEALASYRHAVEADPKDPDAHHTLAMVLQEQGQRDEAVVFYRRAVALKPDLAEAHNNLGNLLKEQGKLDGAVACLRRVLELRPEIAAAHYNLANLLRDADKPHEAVACYRRALELNPNLAEANNNLGNLLQAQGLPVEAIVYYRRAVELQPGFAAAHNNLGNLLKSQGNHVEAVACYRRALELKPDELTTLGSLVHELQLLCQWEEIADLSRRVIDAVDGAENLIASPVPPLAFLALPTPTTARQQLRCARQWIERHLNLPIDFKHRPASRASSPRNPKLTIGYLSADFQTHATAMLIAEVFEKHDRARFTIFGYSYGRDDGSPMRERMVRAVDRFVDVRNASFVAAARHIADDGVDILVDLKGLTADARTQIVALRPAPIQVNYLGYPGTMGAAFMDYILVDDFVVPADQQPHFTEKLVHLSGCYQANDSRREIADRTVSRAECGLPEQGFVFCSFNNSYKITPAVFDVWMRLLKAVPASVLWLLETNPIAADNLRREARARGVAPERLVFAPLTASSEHLSRHRLADLFLDTFPVNAHTTASDALWAGCPLVTLAGETFAARVAGSLLRAVDLSELITTSLDEYERLALELATDWERLAALRARLAAARTTSALFDGVRFARSLERAYTRMWEIHAAGEPPRSLQVESE